MDEAAKQELQDLTNVLTNMSAARTNFLDTARRMTGTDTLTADQQADVSLMQTVIQNGLAKCGAMLHALLEERAADGNMSVDESNMVLRITQTRNRLVKEIQLEAASK